MQATGSASTGMATPSATTAAPSRLATRRAHVPGSAACELREMRPTSCSGGACAQPKGSSFADDKDLYSFRAGDNSVIPAIEEAILGMKQGGIRRIVVPPELGYPDNDYHKSGPQPSTFSGTRALDFVLRCGPLRRGPRPSPDAGVVELTPRRGPQEQGALGCC